ncbi:ABC transporter ATP-binding protein [Rhodospira trueperi]|uniref:Branched-chain amino acid transport system ATP-binding protein/branched-chain amino acid transport system permease protein n=1 Tax=Rhodospira trueperi TaxID=69960 RepID=A0A1G7GFZ8_9PROT|nr:ABC transporter ATP-binding protein [Rhodospira trueperi]SDE87015.1 branched-chain amino acid transport system ATP-binding protein/branched-chain amino acid transport system permease protein [Rhodospira trueperi]
MTMNGARNAGETLLEIRHLEKRFGGVKAVADVTMDLRAGIVTTLVGPNGAGKTTLFNLITGHLPRSGGSVRWLGRDIGGLKPYQIARLGIARTFQDLRLFSEMTVEENILTVMEPNALPFRLSGPPLKERRARAGHVLERTGLADKRAVRAMDLAYAERKFLSLARIMATDARLWLLDEPASGLDPHSYELFLALLREEVSAGVTVCIIEHNLDIVIGISDRIAFLDHGRLLADDDPKTVLEDPALAAIYFGDRS